MSINFSSIIPNGASVSKTAGKPESDGSLSKMSEGFDDFAFINSFLEAVGDKIQSLQDGGKEPTDFEVIPSDGKPNPTGASGETDQMGMDHRFYRTEQGPVSLEMSTTEAWEKTADEDTMMFHFSMLLNVDKEAAASEDAASEDLSADSIAKLLGGLPVEAQKGDAAASSDKAKSAQQASEKPAAQKGDDKALAVKESDKSSSKQNVDDQLAKASSVQDLLERYQAIAGN